MEIYSIAGSIISVRGDIEQKVITFLKGFSLSEMTDSSGIDHCEIIFKCINSEEEMIEIKRKYSLSGKGKDSSFYGMKHRELVGKWTHQIVREPSYTYSFLLADYDWRQLMIVDDNRECDKAGDYWRKLFSRQVGVLDSESEWMSLFLSGTYSYMVQNHTMMIHASAIKYQDKAVLFTAPSGTGKTTQAELWRDYVDAKILNGDRVFIKSTGDEERLDAWGSPWAGSSPYIVNDCAEVSAIIVLEQALDNSLRKMDVAEAMMHLSSNSFLPMWDARCLEGMLGVLDLVLRKVPVYKLACRPDKEAVELVRNEIFG